MEESPWNLILTAVFINFLFVRVVTKVITKPTGIRLIDETLMYLNTQNGFLLNSSVILALTIWLALQFGKDAAHEIRGP
jgi:hypothetical protein